VVYQMNCEKNNDWYWFFYDMKCDPTQQWKVVYEVQLLTKLMSFAQWVLKFRQLGQSM